MTVLLLILAAVLGVGPTVLLAIAIPHLGDQPDTIQEQS